MIKDLTKGKPARVLFHFTLPLFVSVIFQQMYSIGDSAIAGRFVGHDALAAVGASYPITMLFMAVAIGSNIGSSVVISQLFGAKKFTQMKEAIYTSLFSCIGLGLLMSIPGVLFAESIMRLVSTPENIFADSALYLKIFLGGFGFLFLYNISTAVFTAMGDSTLPLIFLIASSVGNIVLDYIFVRYFSMGVPGLAWATFIAQGAAGLLAVLTLKKRVDKIPVKENPKIFSLAMLRKIALIAIPSILQQSFISVGNLMIQTLVNSFGSMVLAGYTAVIKLNTFTIISFHTIGSGISGFTGQNIGAGRTDRVKEGCRAGLMMGAAVGTFFLLLYCVNPRIPMKIFLKEEGVAMQTGIDFIYSIAFLYPFISAKLICDGVLRGAGAMKYFMIATFADLIIRVILAFFFAGFWGARGIWLSWPFGWIVGTAISVMFYQKGYWIKKSSKKDEK
ncbi:MAG: MATE family efflux transporter [Johnsonella sp.]|nr:MATE family efflux transporter [Johnsonella sp.]